MMTKDSTEGSRRPPFFIYAAKEEALLAERFFCLYDFVLKAQIFTACGA